MAPQTDPSSSSSDESSDSGEDLTTQTSQLISNNQGDDSSEEEEEEEDDDDDDDDEEGGSESEPVNPAPPKPASESDSESESESEPEPEPEPAAQLVTPISSKPMMDGPAAGKKSQPQSFQRMFSEDDVIKILESLAEYQEKRGQIKVMSAAVPDFRSFLGKSLSVDVSDAKLYDKIRRLKHKFDVRLKKGGGKFPKEHDKVVYEMSKRVWGGLDGVGESSKKRKKAMSKKEEVEEEKRAKLELGKKSGKGGRYRFLRETVEEGMGNSVWGEGMEGVEKERAREVDKEIKKLRLVEMKHQAEGMGLLKESLELVMVGLERSGL